MGTRFSLETADNGSVLDLTLTGAADIAAARELRDELVAAIVTGRDVVVHVDALDRLDGAGLQLLLAAKASVERNGHAYSVVAEGGAARRAIELAGAEALFGVAREVSSNKQNESEQEERP